VQPIAPDDPVVLDPAEVDAVIFGLDGVLTDTAALHLDSWREAFDEFLAARHPDQSSFTDADYRAYVDGRPRYDGTATFLASRGIELPYGDPSDPPGLGTVCALSNSKNQRFQGRLAGGIAPFPSSLALLEALRDAGVRRAVVSSSRNTVPVLEAAGISEFFEAKVDGLDAAERGLPGKPDPAIFLAAAADLGVDPSRAVVVEDAVSGVQAGRAGGFGLVIGVDRVDAADGLRAAGADVVVPDLARVRLSDLSPPLISHLPSVDEAWEGLAAQARGRRLAVFLDYDGTLSPIVDDPAAATITERTRRAVAGLAQVTTVAVVSGRDTPDVMQRVGVEGLFYAGSHGFDIRRSDGAVLEGGRGDPYLPSLDAAEAELTESLVAIPGAQVERTRFTVTVHYRRVAEADVGRVDSAVAATASRHPDLRRTGGKKVFNLRPNLHWDKGSAVRSLLEALGSGHLPLYLGDDLTDEDAFEVLGELGGGIGIVVRGETDRPTAATYALRDTGEVAAFLETLTRLAGGAG